MTLDELAEFEDEEEERILEQYRRERMAQIKALQSKSNFGDVRDISAEDYVAQVNKAGEGIWVVLHLYKQGIPLCALINQYLVALAGKFPTVKFLRSISTTCIPNYPDQNLPTVFVYHEGEMKASLAGPHHFRGMNMTSDEFEFLLGNIQIFSIIWKMIIFLLQVNPEQYQRRSNPILHPKSKMSCLVL